MKTQLVTPFHFNWIKGFVNCFESHNWNVQVVEKPIFYTDTFYLLMWLDVDTFNFINKYKTKNILFIRRYDFFTDLIERLNWENVGKTIVLNHYFALGLEHRVKIVPKIIHNAVIEKDWDFSTRCHGNDIAFVGFINSRKNLPMAYQILAHLPERYVLHIAGNSQSSEVEHYLDNLTHFLGIHHRIKKYGQIEDINAWLEDKNYILSTSVSEGCPNSVIEAMAKGIKPIVHNYPGSIDQFAPYVFNRMSEAMRMMMPDSEYDSIAYREHVRKKFGSQNFEKVFELANKIAND